MEDLRTVPTKDSAEIADLPPSEVRGVRQHLKGDVRQVQVSADAFGWSASKAKNAGPAALSELRGQLAGKHLNATNSERLDVENRQYCGIHARATLEAAVRRHLAYDRDPCARPGRLPMQRMVDYTVPFKRQLEGITFLSQQGSVACPGSTLRSTNRVASPRSPAPGSS